MLLKWQIQTIIGSIVVSSSNTRKVRLGSIFYFKVQIKYWLVFIMFATKIGGSLKVNENIRKIN